MVRAKSSSLSNSRIFLLTSAIAGMQFGWSLQIGFGTPTFLGYHMSRYLVNYVWLAGPISGMVVQPLIGYWSDRCTHRWGKRKPFFAGGLVFLCFAYWIFANADTLGRRMGDQGSDTFFALSFSVLGFFMVDFAINTIQAIVRPFLVDRIDHSQYNVGNSYLAAQAGIGCFLGYFVGSYDLVGLPALKFLGTNVRALYILAILVAILTVGMTIASTKDYPASRASDPVASEGDKSSFSSTIFKVRTMPRSARHVCVMQFLAWVGWFCLSIYGTAWVGADVFGGDPKATEGPAHDRYEAGVRYGARGLAIQAGISTLLAPSFPFLLRTFGIRNVYFASMLSEAVCLLLPVLIPDMPKHTALALFAALGFAWGVTMCVPWVLASQIFSDSPDKAFFLSIINLFICIPELFVGLTGGLVLKLTGGELRFGLGYGSIFAFTGAVFVFVMVLPEDKSNRLLSNKYDLLEEVRQ